MFNDLLTTVGDFFTNLVDNARELDTNLVLVGLCIGCLIFFIIVLVKVGKTKKRIAKCLEQFEVITAKFDELSAKLGDSTEQTTKSIGIIRNNTVNSYKNLSSELADIKSMVKNSKE